MTMMPRGTPRSAPDPVGEAYEEMLRLWNANGHSWQEPGERPQLRTAPRSQPRAAPRSDPTGYYQLGLEWLTGQGPRHHEFGPNDPATRVLRQHEHIQKVRDQIARTQPKLGPVQDAGYSLSGVKGVPEFLKDYSAVPTGGRTGNLAAAYLGSYELEPVVRGVRDGAAVVDFTARNESSLASAVHIPWISYTKPYQRLVDPLVNSFANDGPGSKKTQRFHWTETIPLRKGAK